MNEKILYIGGFVLPDKNAAAQRVVGIAKGLRELGHEVVFLNSLKNANDIGEKELSYYGFECHEYKREKEVEYLFSGKTAIQWIERIRPTVVIAYNYPALALDHIRKYCVKKKIRCLADATEWYKAVGENFVYRLIKNADTFYRMRCVQKKLDGVIAISRFLYEYYQDHVTTVLIPPTIDNMDAKWNVEKEEHSEVTKLVYAGVPIALKEKLGVIVENVERMTERFRVKLDVVGVTEEQFREMYGWKEKISDNISFWGRIDHSKVIEMVSNADWAVILRDDNRVVKAGFPTKLVESISCGTPVIVNRFSNICDYLDSGNSIILDSIDELEDGLKRACKTKVQVDSSVFDYHSFLQELEKVLGEGSNRTEIQ